MEMVDLNQGMWIEGERVRQKFKIKKQLALDM